MDLLQAARGGDAEERRRLVAAGADLNIRNSKQGTPLHVDAQTGHAEVCSPSHAQNKRTREYRQQRPVKKKRGRGE
jgi:ankyrin repeat protein